MENDTIVLESHHDHAEKLAISHALAQSTKLCVFEEDVSTMVQEVRDIPRTLARTGSVNMSRHSIRKLMGRLLELKCAVNVLTDVLDTPEVRGQGPPGGESAHTCVCVYPSISGASTTTSNSSTRLSVTTWRLSRAWSFSTLAS